MHYKNNRYIMLLFKVTADWVQAICCANCRPARSGIRRQPGSARQTDAALPGAPQAARESRRNPLKRLKTDSEMARRIQTNEKPQALVRHNQGSFTRRVSRKDRGTARHAGMSAFRPGAKSQLPFQGLSKLDGVLIFALNSVSFSWPSIERTSRWQRSSHRPFCRSSGR